MEGPMDRQPTKQHNEYDYHIESNLEDESALDATGYWFAVAVLFVVLGAGVIVYRTDPYNIGTASTDMPAQSNPIVLVSTLPQR
jgi:hypothetical protein